MPASTLLFATALHVIWSWAPPVPPPAPNPPVGMSCERGELCVSSGKARFTRDATLDDKARAKQAKKLAKSKVRVVVSLAVEGGRASVFVDGRWIDLAPIDGLELTPGRHEIEVRDRDVVLARGVLDLSENAKTKGDVAVALVVAAK